MATITKIKVTTDRLQNDIDSLNEHLQKMCRLIDNMMSGIEGMGAMWEGEAKDAFFVQFKSDYQTIKSMENTIRAMIEDLKYAQEKYVSCENNVETIINAIMIGGN